MGTGKYARVERGARGGRGGREARMARAGARGGARCGAGSLTTAPAAAPTPRARSPPLSPSSLYRISLQGCHLLPQQ